MHKLIAMNGPRILLIVGGGIAAYKSCELVRLIRRSGGTVTCVLTDGGAQFVTAMSLSALSENPVHTTLWDLTAELEMGHIQLSRSADLVVVCPATANLLAKMAHGIADDLATTLLLATDKPVLAIPAMNVRMWEHAATQANIRTLGDRGIVIVDPDEGSMACGEYGAGRLPEPPTIWNAICRALSLGDMHRIGAEPQLDLAVLPHAQASDGFVGEADFPDGDAISLSAGLIARKTVSRAVFADQPVDAEVSSSGLTGGSDETSVEPALADEAPPAAPHGFPLLSKKGKAKAAPPTDPDAINHLVTDQAPPEAVPEELAELLAEDPLYGQPDFAGDSPEPAPEAVQRLQGKHVLVTAGPTHEPIDPVRYIANRSSGKQGYAIAAAAAQLGARVTLVSGPVALECPPGVDRVFVETARDMAGAVKQALPADVAVMVAAVADWRTSEVAGEKMKKRGSAPPALRLTENPDILSQVAASDQRPRLVIGFAAETENLIDNAAEKRKRKGANWIIANDVSGPTGKGVMGGEMNLVHIVTEQGVETLPEMPKDEVARAIVERIADALSA